MRKSALILGSFLSLALVACDDNGNGDGSTDASDGTSGASDENTEVAADIAADTAGGDTGDGTIDVVVTGFEPGSGSFCAVLISYVNNTGAAFDNVGFNIQYHDGDQLVGGAGCGMAGLGSDASGDRTCNASTDCDALEGVTYSVDQSTVQCNTQGEDTGYEPCPDLITVTSDIGG